MLLSQWMHTWQALNFVLLIVPGHLSVGRYKGHCLATIMGYSETAREEQRLQPSALPAELSKEAQGVVFVDWIVCWVFAWET